MRLFSQYGPCSWSHDFTVFEDGLSYNSDELEKLGNIEIDRNLHLIKKVFSIDGFEIERSEKLGIQSELIF
jgi:hypothetical protein